MIQNNYNSDIIKTNTIDINDESHPLPPHLGVYDIYKVSEWKDCPVEWRKDGRFIKIKEGEPFWIDLQQNSQCACLVSVQRLNPVTGEHSDIKSGLSKDPKQNYLKLPEQRWLDGYYNHGKVYQFKITKAGQGLAVNENILPEYMQDSHAIGIAFYAPKIQEKEVPTFYPNIWGSPHINNFYYYSEYDKYYQFWSNIWLSSSSSSFSFGPPNQFKFTQNNVHANKVADSSIVRSVKQMSYGIFSKDADYQDTSLIESQEDSIDAFNVIEENTIEDFAQVGVGAGGRIEQGIFQDPNTIEFYQSKPVAMHIYYLVFEEQFNYIIGKGKVDDSAKIDDTIKQGCIGGNSVPLI